MRLRRTPTLVVLVVMALAVAACGDDDARSVDPATLNSCESVADAGIGLLQDMLDFADSLSAEELASLTQSEEAPPAFVAIEDRGTALRERATVIGCSEEQMDSLMAARVDDVSSDTPFGQFIIESVRNGEGDFFE